jgi:Glyoxalase-like domain
MRLLFFLLLTSVLLTKGYGQNSLKEISINHVPIVVADLEKTKKTLVELGFKVKNGRKHVGINNCFIKFADGTYLEFIEPLDSSFSIGQYYTKFLKQRQGATALAIDIEDTKNAKKFLSDKHIPFESDSNSIWQTISPQIKDTELFFIEYADKTWKDTKENTTHINGALLLSEVWSSTKKVANEIDKYAKFGFKVYSKTKKHNTDLNTINIGKSKINILDISKSNDFKHNFTTKHFEGICGFTIKVQSLEKLKNGIKSPKNLKILSLQNQIVVFLPELNFFMVFVQ